MTESKVDVRSEAATVLVIEGAPALDPIRVICMNEAPGAGRIIVQCYTRAWVGWWGAMGERTVEEFFTDCHPDYLRSAMAHDYHEHDDAYLLRVIQAVQSALAALAACTPARSEGR